MTSNVLYLDTSDLSYLARGDVVNGIRYASLREDLVRLSNDGRVRIRLSFIQLVEATQLQNSEVFAEGLRFLRSMPGVTFSLVGPEAVFKAELDKKNVDLREVPLSTIPTHLVDSRLTLVNHLWPLVGKTLVRAHQLSRNTRLSETSSTIALKRAVLGGDARLALSRKQQREKVQPNTRMRLAVAVTRPMRAMLAKSGMHLKDDSRTRHSLQESGLSWIAALGPERVRLAVAIGDKWLKEPPSGMPACALRIAFEHRLFMSSSDEFSSGDLMDPLHLAYAAYSDAATVDRRVHEFTEKTQRFLQRPSHLGWSGDLANTLCYIEKHWK